MNDVGIEKASLPLVLGYKHSDLLNRFASKYHFSLEESETIFNDVKTWLYLVGTRTPDAPPLVILPAMDVVDDLWHEFILYTTDYAEFCHNHFGHFIHHEPTRDAERDELRSQREHDPVGFRSKKRKELEEFIGYVHDKLGSDTCLRWFSGVLGKSV